MKLEMNRQILLIFTVLSMVEKEVSHNDIEYLLSENGHT
jgi:hypothetical protein